MQKINFVNNSTPALNATNLNKLQDNVEDLIKTETTTSDIDTYSCNYINTLGDTYEYHLPRNTETLYPNGWRALSSGLTTGVLPAGKYMVIVSTSISGTSSGGMITINPYLDTDKTGMNTRQTIPITSGLISTCTNVFFAEFDSASTHIISVYGYASQNFTVYDGYYGLMATFVRIKN